MMRALDTLVIRGSPDEFATFLQRLEESPPDGWARDHEAEDRWRAARAIGDQTFCIRCTEAPGRPAAVLEFRPRRSGEWRVPHITPRGQLTLSDEEYNHILAEFASQVLEPLSRGTAIRSEILPPQIRLEDCFSFGAAQKLRDFSSTANRTSLQPSDRERWQQFVIRAHLDNSIMDTELLEGWLASQGWPEPMRQELSREFEAMSSLLWNYDEERCRSCPHSRR
jgi:hypothetical protein